MFRWRPRPPAPSVDAYDTQNSSDRGHSRTLQSLVSCFNAASQNPHHRPSTPQYRPLHPPTSSYDPKPPTTQILYSAGQRQEPHAAKRGCHDSQVVTDLRLHPSDNENVRFQRKPVWNFHRSLKRSKKLQTVICSLNRQRVNTCASYLRRDDLRSSADSNPSPVSYFNVEALRKAISKEDILAHSTCPCGCCALLDCHRLDMKKAKIIRDTLIATFLFPREEQHRL